MEGRTVVVPSELLRVQRAAARLDVILQLLAALADIVQFAHRDSPDPARDAADDCVLGVHAVGEEPREVAQELVGVEAARLEQLDVRQPV